MQRLVADTVRDYLAGLASPEDDVLAEVRRRSLADGVPAPSRDTAWLLHVLTAAVQAARVFEIGTGYGYSGMHVARALPAGGVLLTVERHPARAALAKEHFERAGLAAQARVMVGPATRLVHKVAGPFDVIVQDGDKADYEPLLDHLIGLLRPRGVLVSDNILWSGDVVPGSCDTPAHRQDSIDAIRRYNTRLASDPRLDTVFLPVGDGVAVSVKRV
ncbi:MAG: O-methyltransferase [Acidobacteriota bacterium]